MALESLAGAAGLDHRGALPDQGHASEAPAPPFGDTPPYGGALSAEIASELYGHYAEAPARTPAEVDAQAEAQKQSIARKVEAEAEVVGKKVEEDKQQAPGRPVTPEALEQRLGRALEKEMGEMEEKKATALKALDEKIAEQAKLVEDGVLPDDAAGAMERDLRGEVEKQKGTITEEFKGNAEAALARAQEEQKASVERAEKEADDMIRQGDTQADRIEKDGQQKALMTLLDFQRRAFQVMGAAGSKTGEKPEEQRQQIMAEAIRAVEKLNTDGKKAHDDAIRAARQAAEGHRQLIRQRAETHKAVAGGHAVRYLGEGANQSATAGATLRNQHQAIENAATPHVDAGRGIAKNTREEQRKKAADTREALMKERADLESRLNAEIEAKRKAITTRLDGLRKQVAAGGGDVDAALRQIDKSSDDLETSANRQVTAATQRIKQKATQAIAILAAKGKAAMSQIEARAAAAGRDRRR